MKVIGAVLVLIAVQLADARPQDGGSLSVTPPLEEQTAAPSDSGSIGVDTIDSSYLCCPTGKYFCHPCAKLVLPHYFILKPYNGDYKPAYFAYLTKDGTYRYETIFLTKYGPKVFGGFGYFEKCSGARIDQTYEADHKGFRSGVIYLTDGAVDAQLPEFDLTLVPEEEQLAAAAADAATTVAP